MKTRARLVYFRCDRLGWQYLAPLLEFRSAPVKWSTSALAEKFPFSSTEDAI